MSWKRGDKTKVARAAGIPLQNLSGYLSGSMTMSQDMAKRLERATLEVLGDAVPAESWMFRDRFPHPLLSAAPPAPSVGA